MSSKRTSLAFCFLFEWDLKFERSSALSKRINFTNAIPKRKLEETSYIELTCSSYRGTTKCTRVTALNETVLDLRTTCVINYIVQVCVNWGDKIILHFVRKVFASILSTRFENSRKDLERYSLKFLFFILASTTSNFDISHLRRNLFYYKASRISFCFILDITSYGTLDISRYV